MSRGPGRVERAIEEAFRSNPTETFTAGELAVFVYPGLNRVEKKHRVAILRAGYRVAPRLHWLTYRCERPGGDIVFCNGLDVQSYTMGRARADFIWNGQSVEEISHQLRNPSDYPYAKRWHELHQPGGTFAVHVRINRLYAEGRSDEAKQLARELQAQVWASFQANVA